MPVGTTEKPSMKLYRKKDLLIFIKKLKSMKLIAH